MKNFLLAFCLLFAAAVCTAQSQATMNAGSGDDFKKADGELNAVYQKILKAYSSDKTFVARLKAAQKIWIQLREADAAAKFPAPSDYGSAFPMCMSQYKADLTRERTKHLQVWLDGIEEGDVCAGSVHTKGQ